MSVHSYTVRTTSTGGADAAVAVDCYLDEVLTTTVNMPYYDWSNIWKEFDGLIRIQYDTQNFLWIVEIIGDIENYQVGDTVSWMYSASRTYTFTENEPTPPPPPTPGFDVHLMNNTEELNKITKNPTLVRTLHGFLRDTTDLVDPEIIIEFDGVLVDCNYMHIPIFNRYYFINKIESVRTKLWKVYAHCDVLKTYSEGILGTEAVVSRNENRYNLYLNDSMYKVTSDPRLQIAKFPKKFEGESYVLVMNGARYIEPSE